MTQKTRIEKLKIMNASDCTVYVIIEVLCLHNWRENKTGVDGMDSLKLVIKNYTEN
jgi:hypothetical protein